MEQTYVDGIIEDIQQDIKRYESIMEDWPEDEPGRENLEQLVASLYQCMNAIR